MRADQIPETHYQCEMCGEIFKKDRSEDEAIAEALANGFDLNDDIAVVCDDCYRLVMGEAERN
jgi:hypothetical protein